MQLSARAYETVTSFVWSFLSSFRLVTLALRTPNFPSEEELLWKTVVVKGISKADVSYSPFMVYLKVRKTFSAVQQTGIF